MKILIVELQAHRVDADCLRPFTGHEVTVAHSLREAYKLLPEGGYDVLLTGIMFPTRISPFNHELPRPAPPLELGEERTPLGFLLALDAAKNNWVPYIGMGADDSPVERRLCNYIQRVTIDEVYCCFCFLNFKEKEHWFQLFRQILPNGASL